MVRRESGQPGHVALDDFAYMDSHGVPRAEDGSAVRILDLSTTFEEAYLELLNGESLASDPATFVAMPLAEYGDSCERSFFWADYGPRSENDRDVILQRCESVVRNFLDNMLKYSFLHGNCEHYATFVVSGVFKSPELVMGLWSLLRLGVQFLAVAAVLLVRKDFSYPDSVWVMLVLLPQWVQLAVNYRRRVGATLALPQLAGYASC